MYPKFHLALLDEFAKTDLGDRKAACERAWEEYRRVSRQLESAMAEGSDRAKQMDFLLFEIEEIESAALKPGEDEELEQ